MRTIEEAWSLLSPHLDPVPSETLSLAAADGRILAKPLAATLDVPPSDVSAMDGFALPELEAPGVGSSSAALAADGPGNSLEAEIGPTIAAGDAPGITLGELQPGSGLPIIPRIMTGAPVPVDCDRVVPVELAELQEASDSTPTVRFVASVLNGERRHIRRQGEVSRNGTTLIEANQTLHPATASLLATHGIDQVSVIGKPSVAYFTTGSEIVPASAQPRSGQIRDSHSAFFDAATKRAGIAATSLGIVADDIDLLRATVEQGLGYRVLLLSGGVSMGEFDLVDGVLGDLGCEVVFDGVSIQPGKPLLVARKPRSSGHDTLIFGLPGNPASAQVTYWLFVEPALRRLSGSPAAPWDLALNATLAAPLPGAKGRDRFLPCAVERAQGSLLATPAPPRGSHDVVAYGVHTGLVRVSANAEPAGVGEPCSVLQLS